MADFRIIDNNGQRLNLTCENRKCKTDTTKGKPHGAGQPLGSVFDDPLVDHGGHSLWLEHTTWKPDNSPTYWLMWYDSDGIPTISFSAAMDRADLVAVACGLASFVP